MQAPNSKRGVPDPTNARPNQCQALPMPGPANVRPCQCARPCQCQARPIRVRPGALRDLLQLDHEPLKTALRTQQKPTIWVAQRDAAIWVRILPRVGTGPPGCLRADEQICLRCLKSSPQRLCSALDDDVCVGEQPRLGRAVRTRRLQGPLKLPGLLPHPRVFLRCIDVRV